MTASLPQYITDNTFVRDGRLIVCNIPDLTSEQRKELQAMSFAFAYAGQNGVVWDESNLFDARRFAAHLLVPGYLRTINHATVTFMSADTMAENYGVTLDLARYRRTHGRAYTGPVTTLKDQERKNLNRMFSCM